jgi:hypothetical protein
MSDVTVQPSGVIETCPVCHKPWAQCQCQPYRRTT